MSSIRLSGAALGDKRVRLAWVNVPPTILDIMVDGAPHDQAMTASTIVFLEEQAIGKRTYQLRDPATGVKSNIITLTVK